MTDEPRRLLGGPIAKRLKTDIRASAVLLRERGGVEPVLTTLLVGRHPAAEAYRRSIERSVTTVGIDHRPITLVKETGPRSFVETIHRLNEDAATTAVLVLMPLPDHLAPELVMEHLSPLKDVDGITPTNAGRLHLGLPSLRPSTPQGGIEILDHYGLGIAGRSIVVIGRSNVVGRPLSTMLSLRDATVTLCHRQTRNLTQIARTAEIVAVAAGHPGLVTSAMVKKGGIVVDFGVNVVDGRIVGDADEASIAAMASAYTPVPGGVGPVTTLMLARNTVAAGFAALGGSLDHVGFSSTTD